MRRRRCAGSATTATPIPPTTTSARRYSLSPRDVLPSAGQVREQTGLAVNAQLEPSDTVGPDNFTTPSDCALAGDPATRSTWGQASAVSGQLFTDGTADDYHSMVGTALGVFDTATSADGTLAQVRSAVQACRTFTGTTMDAPRDGELLGVQRAD